MTVKPERQAAFPLSLRIPAWCESPAVSVNGTSVSAKPDPKGFLRLQRSWKDGDTIRLHFPMLIQVATGTDKNLKPAAPYATVSYGPLLFALAIPDTKNPNTPDPAAAMELRHGPHRREGRSGPDGRGGAMPAKWDWPLESPLKLRVAAVRFRLEAHA